jgi:hypothetical protein
VYLGSIPAFLYSTPRLGLLLELFSPLGTEKSGLKVERLLRDGRKGEMDYFTSISSEKLQPNEG